jgi:hypothetical protein
MEEEECGNSARGPCSDREQAAEKTGEDKLPLLTRRVGGASIELASPIPRMERCELASVSFPATLISPAPPGRAYRGSSTT